MNLLGTTLAPVHRPSPQERFERLKRRVPPPSVFSRTQWTVAIGLAILGWTLYLPETLPFFGTHMTNLRLELEIDRLQQEIARMESTRDWMSRTEASIGRDPQYWEAVARANGMRIPGEVDTRRAPARIRAASTPDGR